MLIFSTSKRINFDLYTFKNILDKVTRYIFTSIFFLQSLFLISQEQLLVDSIIHSGFEAPNFGFTYGVKFLYDSDLRIISEKADHYKYTYEYGIRSNTEVRERANGEKLISKSINNAAGNYLESIGYYLSPNSNDTIETNYYTRTLNIYNQTKQYKTYISDNGDRSLRLVTTFDYTANRSFKTSEYIYYDENQQITNERRSFYHYNEKDLLSYKIIKRLDNDTGILRCDSTTYEYDDQSRIIRIRQYYPSGAISEDNYEYFPDYYTRDLGSIKNYYYYSESEHFPLDSIVEFDLVDEKERLASKVFYRDVSADNPEYDLAILHNKAYYDRDDGSLSNFRQDKKLYLLYTIEPKPSLTEIEFQIVSNPTAASYYFNIICPSNDFDKIKIFDNQGRLIKTHYNNNISIQNLRAPDAAGIYLVQLWRGNQRVSQTKKLQVY